MSDDITVTITEDIISASVESVGISPDKASVYHLKTVDPTTSDINYGLSDVWINQTTKEAWKLIDLTGGVATWIYLGSSAGFVFEKLGTATAGTQYNSKDLEFVCSVWDNTNQLAEDRKAKFRLIAGSGVDGYEPYKLALLNNSGTEVWQWDLVNNLFYMESIIFADDSGPMTAFDMTVTATPIVGTEESYAFKIDGQLIAQIYAEADGLGGIQNAKFITHELLVDKKGIANAGTQYDSYNLKLKCSVWDTTNEQAEDRVFNIYVSGSSGPHGAEVYYLNCKDNDGNWVFQLNPIDRKFTIEYETWSRSTDANTGIFFPALDQLSLIAGNVQMIDLIEDDSQDMVRIGYNENVNVYIGPNGKGLMVRGSDGILQLVNSGYQFLYDESIMLANDAYLDLPNTKGGWAMVLFDEGAERAFVTWNTNSVVTGEFDSGANISYIDEEGKYCIFDNGSNVRIKNRFGSQKRVTVFGLMR